MIRTFTKALSLLVLCAATFSACKKDKDDNNASGQLSATVGGTAFQPAAVTSLLYSTELIITGFQIKSGDTTYLSLSIPSSATTTAALDFDDVDVDYYNSKSDYTSFSSKSHGTVSVTTFDKSGKKIAGKFSGVLYQWGNSSDSVIVKDGQFNTSYQTF
ncbi:MAG TPA: DUF5025 domain-containing protein [Niastella sp.]